MVNPHSKRLIVVEGDTDLHIVLQLFKRNNPQIDCDEVSDYVKICQEGGVDQMCRELSTWLKEPKLECIGFVFDANSDPKKRWKQVREKILQAYIEVRPVAHTKLKKAFCANPVPEGIWIRDCKPKVGMWMMPNNEHPGTIENFLTEMIPPEDYRWDHAQNYVQTTLEKKEQFSKHKIFPKTKQMKADIYAWLAIQEDPGMFPGAAIKRKYFNSDAPKAQPFQKWLGDLP